MIDSNINPISNQQVLAAPPNQVLESLGSSTSGLTSEEATRRLEQYGPNAISGKRRISVVAQYLSHFKSPITLILLFAAVLSGILADVRDTIIIFIIVLTSVSLDFFQEYRAERSVEKLIKRVATTATVLRDSHKQEIGIAELVPGDIIFLSAGDVVPADSRILTSKDLFIDQSALTGESFPAEKNPAILADSNLDDSTKWTNFLFSGTSVTNGTAMAVVIKTGSSTEYGDIVKKNLEKKPETEFERGLKRFGYLIIQVTFVLVIFVFIINALYKHSFIESLLFAVALSVGLTPGLLPMILSINLSRGSTNMSKKGVIVKRLAAIQNFGSMDVLCADKTGTLTQNTVTVILHVDFQENDSEKVLLYSFLNSSFQTGLRNPLDEAILKYKEIDISGYQKVDELPFDFSRKRLSVVVSNNDNTIIITKGAPEEINKVVSSYELNGDLQDISQDALQRIEKTYNELSARGLRVLGVCYRVIAGTAQTLFTVPDETNMVFLGFIAFEDPLKETAGESLELLRQAGVKLKILTGDNELVARNIGQQLGFQVYKSRRRKTFDETLGYLVSTPSVETMNIVRGTELAAIDDNALARVVEKADIFTRITPAQKSRIMNALKANGHVVGFIGDGINDTPSMKVADVSISVVNAVDIAKESAEIILLNNDLTLIRDGVIEGRKTFGNTMKYVLMAISSNFGNMFSAAAASLFLNFLPMLPIQILLNNLLYSFAQLSIPTDNVDPEYLERPQRLQTSFIRDFMISFGPVSSIFDFLTFFVMLVIFKASAPLFQTAWFVESLLTQTLVIFAIRTRKVPFFKSAPSKPLVLNILVVLAFAIALPFTKFGGFFSFVPLPINFLLILIVFIIAYFGLVEWLKKWFYARRVDKPEVR
jgi:Mg2+-importing ATPase